MMERIPTDEELSAFYASYAYDEEGYLSPLTINSYQALLDEFEPYRKTNRILDVGCGRGWFLLEAQKRGWEVYGTEYSPKAVELCEKDGIQMLQGALTEQGFDADSFDVITSFEVLEHINNPIEDLGHIHRYLRSKGLFYLTTPNFNAITRYYLKAEYNIIHYPEHLSYYTKSTLELLARKMDFKKVKFLSTGFSLTRFKTSQKADSEEFISEESSDEKLRRSIESKWYLGLLKNWINWALTLTNTGTTLKGYFEKK